ncbi:MAG: ankyrin repeat domain-containing protein [Pseudomonadota bacterium]
MDDLEGLKREAKELRKAYERGDRQAVLQARQWLGQKAELKHADFLHAVARERGFESWPKLKVAAEAQGLTRVEAQERLKQALYFGQKVWVDRLLQATPDLADGRFDLACALYDVDAVRAGLARDPSLAVASFGGRRPILHVAFSQYNQMAPDAAARALSVAEMLLDHGADANDGFPMKPGAAHLLPALYGAIGHARHLSLARLLLERGADPNDNESLYHAVEQRGGEALAILLEHGADPAGTNALYRAMDFDDVAAVAALIDAGADPNEAVAQHPSGEVAEGLVGLHHAVQRMCGAQMIELLIARGAKLDVQRGGLTAYGLALVFGNEPAAEALAAAGASKGLPGEVEKLLEGRGPIDAAKLPPDLKGLAVELVHFPAALTLLKRYIAAGLPWDEPDRNGLTPVQSAGWRGDGEAMAYLLSLKPDLSHVNGYGGTLLSTIIHGSENAPPGGNHVGCLELALAEGVALPRPAIRHAGREDVVAFLEDWAERHPGQVVAHGIA